MSGGAHRRLPAGAKFAAGLFVIAILLLQTMVPATEEAVAATGINRQINFQGKVVNSNGTNVADGSYTFVFKLYSQQAPGGTAIWTETKSLATTDGIFQTNLGSVTSLPGAVDFNSDNLYLGMAFNGDAEMTPRIQFTASAYAFNSDLLDGLDASAFAQLNPASAQSGSLNVTGSLQAATSLLAPALDTATGVPLTIGATTASSLTVGRSGAAFTLQGNSGSSLKATSGSFTTTVGFATPTANNSLLFPNAGGTICTTVASTCSGTYATAGGSYVNLQSTTPGTADIGNFNINGVGIVGSSLLTPLLDTPVGVATLNIGTNNATSGISMNQNVTLIAGKNLTMASGAGTFNHNFTSATGTAETLSVTASGAIGTTTVKGQVINLTGTNNPSGSNTVTGLEFGSVAGATNNTFYGIAFGTGMQDLVRYNGTQLISGSGLLQNAAIDSALTYSSLQRVGALSVGSIVSGFGSITTGNAITGTVINGTTSINTGAGAGTTRIDGSGNLSSIGNISGTGAISITTGAAGVLALQPSPGASLTGAVTKSAATGNEIAYDLATTINKTTSGNYTGLRLNVMETNAPGTANLLMDLQANNASRFSVTNGGVVSIAGVGSANTAAYLCRNASNQIASCSGTATGSAFVQGGNSFNAAGDLGTNDNFALHVRTNNATRLTISTSGDVTYAAGTGSFDQSASSGTFRTGTGAVSLNGATVVQPAANVAAFNVTVGAGGGSVLKVDSSNLRVGINLGSGNFGLASGIAGLDVNGALRLSGGATYADTMTSPAGAGVPTKINIPVYDPGNFGQILAFGISSSAAAPAAASARGIAVFDQRGYQSGAVSSPGNYSATPHQPSIGVFSPNEAQIAGFSWEGLNTTFYVKSTADAIGLRVGSGNLDVLSAQNVGGAARVGVNTIGPAYTLDVGGDINASGTIRAATFDTATGVAMNIGAAGAPLAAVININQDTQLAAGKNLTMASGTGRFVQTYTGTTADAQSLTANSLSTGAALRIVSASNSAANTSWSAVSLNPTNAQSGTAVSGANLISGLDVQFTQAPSVAGNSETVANLAVTANGSAPADSTVASILNLANNDTATGNQITVTDGLKINGANMINGINLSGTFGTNLITSTNFSVSQAGAIVGVGLNAGSGLVQGTGGLTLSGTTSVNANTNAATSINTGSSTGLVSIGGGAGTFALNTTNIDISNTGAITGATGLVLSSGTLQVGGAAGSGALVNNGSTVNTVLAIANLPGGGSIGSAAATVDIYSYVSLAQTTAGQTITVPAPTVGTTYGRMLYLSNVGTASFTLLGTTVAAGSSAALVWAGTSGGASWTLAGADGSGILNQSASDQSADFRITGTGRANTAFTGPLFDALPAGALNIGTSAATGITIGKTGITTTTAGTFQLGATAGSGGLINNGTMKNTALAIANLATGGAIGTAAATVDLYTAFTVNQTTAGQTITIPTPTVGAAASTGRIIYISNIGSASFTLLSGGATVNAGTSATLIFNGSAWTFAGADGSSILNQTTADQSASYRITGTGVLGSGLQIGGTAYCASGCGDLNFATGSNRVLKVLAAAAGNGGNSLTLAAGDGNGTNQAGGALVLQGGLATGSGAGGVVTVRSQTNAAAAFTVQNASSVAQFTVDTASSIVMVGDTTNGASFSAARELTFSGTARHASAIRLTAEFSGAVLDADGTANTGTMTAAYDAVQRFGYYKWVTSQGSAQDYDLVVTLPVPDDFSAWSTTAPTFYNYGSAGSAMTVTILDTAGTVEPNYNAEVLAVSTTWTARSATPTTMSGTYTPGSNMVIRIKMTAAATSGDVRLGTITLPYLTRW